ncbi:MAG: hypothetical protein ACOY71_05325 [Gemmatimonadota bacterium]
MPYDYAIDQRIGRIHVRVVGLRSYAEIVGLIRSILEDPLYRATHDVLADLCEQRYTPRLEEAWSLAQLLGSIRPAITGRVALLLRPRFGYGVANQVAAFAASAGVAMRPFTLRLDAERWLDEGRG